METCARHMYCINRASPFQWWIIEVYMPEKKLKYLKRFHDSSSKPREKRVSKIAMDRWTPCAMHVEFKQPRAKFLFCWALSSQMQNSAAQDAWISCRRQQSNQDVSEATRKVLQRRRLRRCNFHCVKHGSKGEKGIACMEAPTDSCHLDASRH